MEEPAATRPETTGVIAYRYAVSWFRFSLRRRLTHVLALAMFVSLIAAACGGGSADGGADGGDDDVANTTVETAATPTPLIEPEATPTRAALATSTPLPTATPLPTSTPEPLEAPTPSTVLLTTAFTNSSQVTTVGIDEVFFGMTPDEAAKAASTAWVELPSGNGQCYRITPANGPDRLELWVVDGFLERLDIEHPDIRTRSKLGVGNTLAELRGQLGDRLSVETTGDGGQVATFTPSDPGDAEFRLIFELEDDKVVRYRSGRIGIIQRSTASC